MDQKTKQGPFSRKKRHKLKALVKTSTIWINMLKTRLKFLSATS